MHAHEVLICDAICSMKIRFSRKQHDSPLETSGAGSGLGLHFCLRQAFLALERWHFPSAVADSQRCNVCFALIGGLLNFPFTVWIG
jgi:hypothetical protein